MIDPITTTAATRQTWAPILLEASAESIGSEILGSELLFVKGASPERTHHRAGCAVYLQV
jgi:hypothetical protein